MTGWQCLHPVILVQAVADPSLARSSSTTFASNFLNNGAGSRRGWPGWRSLPEQPPLVAEIAVQSLGGEWQERREESLERVNRLQRGEDRLRRLRLVLLDLEPRALR